MPSYRWPIPVADRWAIIAYIRQLERKRQASATGTLASAASAPATAAGAPAANK
jgi:hypothetical protein